MLTFPTCKVNIGLFITNRRPDGYHDIETVMVPVAWNDILEIVPTKGNEATLTCTGRTIDCPTESNIVMKAYRALNREVELPQIDIYLHKVVPDGAGLGGGSADAAFTLRTLNEMFALNLGDDRLRDIAAGIGADCPFFISDAPCMATGTGTTLSPLPLSLKSYYIAIVKPQVSMSTREAYAGVTPKMPSIDLRKTLIELPPEEWEKAGVSNDFEASVLTSHPEIREVKERMKASGAVYASMSGSGSAVFGIFTDDKMADHAVAVYPKELRYVGRMQ